MGQRGVDALDFKIKTQGSLLVLVVVERVDLIHLSTRRIIIERAQIYVDQLGCEEEEI